VVEFAPPGELPNAIAVRGACHNNLKDIDVASTTGMLYVLDEPSVGLHPSNVGGLRRTIQALVANGNSVVIVEHERELIRTADWVIELELGPGVGAGAGAGAGGGELIAEGHPANLEHDPDSVIGPYLAGSQKVTRRKRPAAEGGQQVEIDIVELFNLRDVRATFPMHQLTGVAGPSGAGKTALVLDSLVPALRAHFLGGALPAHVRRLEARGIGQVVEIDASPIGQNARSTPATYSGAFDEIRTLLRVRRWPAGGAGSRGASPCRPSRGGATRVKPATIAWTSVATRLAMKFTSWREPKESRPGGDRHLRYAWARSCWTRAAACRCRAMHGRCGLRQPVAVTVSSVRRLRP
jgi:hypothetical protein